MLESMGCPNCQAMKQFGQIEMEFRENRERLQMQGGQEQGNMRRVKDQKMPASSSSKIVVENKANNNSWATLAKRVTERQKVVDNNTCRDLILFDNDGDEVLDDTSDCRDQSVRSNVVGDELNTDIDDKDISPDDLQKLVKILEPVLGDYKQRMNKTSAVKNQVKTDIADTCKAKKTASHQKRSSKICLNVLPIRSASPPNCT